jgi:hypothetical protein
MCLVAAIGIGTKFNEKAGRIFDTVFWLVLGIAGLVITLLWFFTDHSATKNNLNIFWALPTHLFFFNRRNRTATVDLYFMVTGIIAALLLFCWTFLPQALPLPALPLLVLILVKAVFKS